MVWIPGGWFWMGVDTLEKAKDAPRHKVYVDGFWMDKTPVTNEEFARFVKATGYKTVAEVQPDPKDFPDVPRDTLKPFSIVFKSPGPGQKVDLKDHSSWWHVSYGACWLHPEGPDSDIKSRGNHPVVHICWTDAVAYCKWAKKRLPTEAEWEFAVRGGLDRKKYCWGNELLPGGKWQANIWQGDFPYKDDRKDGYHGTSPVGAFPPNGYGLVDMSGNVHQCCSDWYHPDYYTKSSRKNPKGPNESLDPNEPGVPKRVMRGGSYLCADNYCACYLVGARGKGEPSSGLSHSGIRCARDHETGGGAPRK
jgi:formylglycine-generating enzyme required for sulfatase activity